MNKLSISDCKHDAKNMSNHELHDFNKIIKSSLKYLKNEIKTEQISLQKKFTPNLPKVLANTDDISLMIVNLLTNALDSMSNGGKLLIESKYCVEHESCVQLSISDTGFGIKKNKMDKIFYPFFTTKDEREGIGLGLAISKKIIEDHSGKIKVSSSSGIGTTFTVCFPTADKILSNK